MPRISAQALSELEKAMEEYRRYVAETRLSQRSKLNYLRYVDQFVRWLDYDFEPGGRLSN